MVKSPIKVFVRTRPVTYNSSRNLSINEEEGWISLNLPRKEAQGHINHQIENWGFRFDGILSNASQEEVFDRIAKDTITSALEGYSGTIFCYGQTGAGKTFTMSGSTSSYKQRGIIPRAIHALFQEIQERSKENIEVKVSYLEIYNENMRDLLTMTQEPITINEDGRGGIVLKGLTRFPCKGEEDGLNMFFDGEINKTKSQHSLNNNSSRSHSIFTLYIQSQAKVGLTKRMTYSKINLVDLAGSERVKKTGSEGQTLIEANYINKSLTFLQQVVCALSEKQRDHVPYRQSKLTNLLKDSIGGNCKTTMIANIWPEASNLEETISTLKFATRIKQVSNDPIPNVFVDLLSPQKRLDCSERNSVSLLDQTNSEPLTQKEKDEQRALAKLFMNGKSNDVELKSPGQVKELLNQCRNVYQTLCEAMQEHFHSLPANKLEEIGINMNLYPRKSNHVGRITEKNSLRTPPTKEKFPENHSLDYTARSEKGIPNFSFEERQGRAKKKVLECSDENRTRLSVDPYGVSRKNIVCNSIKEAEEDDKNLEKRLLKSLAGVIRQKSQAKRESEKKNRAFQSKTLNSQIEQEQQETKETITGGDMFEKEMQTDHDYSQDINEIKARFKVHTEKINELKTTILSADENIKRSRSLVVEKIEEILQPERISTKSGLQGQNGFNQGRVGSTRNSIAPRMMY